MRRKGWFAIPGVQEGDRTLEEQMMGLAPALAECAGKTVLDLGCAEGLIGREFARAGAKHVLGIELLGGHIEVARAQCAEAIRARRMQFVCAHLDAWIGARPVPRFDLVLALSVAHKLHDPRPLVEFIGQAARELVCFRAPAAAVGGLVRSKHRPQNAANVNEILARHGWKLAQRLDGVRGESVQYWRCARRIARR